MGRDKPIEIKIGPKHRDLSVRIGDEEIAQGIYKLVITLDVSGNDTVEIHRYLNQRVDGSTVSLAGKINFFAVPNVENVADIIPEKDP